MVAVRDVTSGSGLSGRLIFVVQSVHRSLKLSKFYSCQMLTKLEFSRQIIKKIPNSKFDENPPSWKPVAPC